MSSQITKEHLVERIKDWKERISNLYKMINTWLEEKQGYSIRISDKVNMYEELMKRFGIEQQFLDVADIYKDNKIILTIKPVGLWIIGANGRIDLISKDGSFIMVDIADHFEDPNWTIFRSNDRRNSQILSKELFFDILNN